MAFFQWCHKPFDLLILKPLMWWEKKKRRGERNTFLPLQSLVAGGAGTLAEDAALPLHDPGSIGGIKWHSFTTCFFPVGKFRCDKSSEVKEDKPACPSLC